jgi:hypothetical protein
VSCNEDRYPNSSIQFRGEYLSSASVASLLSAWFCDLCRRHYHDEISIFREFFLHVPDGA